ncbi:hypothetical protein [Aquimarina sp. 2201CG14-23]|uniref:hypothetical protein n=1 Tax=Aquimarina mycalae TaxID=3040073 RepID=UPI002477D107|nr:hypothetical protein [Aquimarina sp. 2201CG14-23]MDH7444521.1 hypothetical protein [Aquimarina sp. 2201CG14-23]
MKSNQEILDKFGKILIENVFEDNYEILSTNILKNIESGELKEKTSSLVKDSLESLIFDFLRIFDENEEFKIIHKEEGKEVDLLKISEDLKSEHMIEDGWISRFSQTIKN